MAQLELHDVALYYEDEGQGPPVVLVHGWGTSARVWGAQQADLAVDHRVVALDWRGCGRSSRPAAGNDPAHVVEDLRQVIHRLGIDRPVVVGSSIGAVFATELALEEPDLLKALVCVDGPAHQAASSGFDAAALQAALRADRPGTVAGWVAGWCAPGASPALIDWTVRQILDSGPFIDAHFSAVQGYDPRSSLADLRVPLHLIHGEADRQVPVQVAEECAAAARCATLTVLAGAGHLPHQEVPTTFNAALRRLLG